MINIDGTIGEGGGQVLRTSLALSIITGKSIRIDNIRAGRKNPGLLRQHLTCVKAAEAISNADVSGDKLGSRTLEFAPSGIFPGDHTFDIESAGSTTLVLQTVYAPLLVASEPSTFVIKGGTHNPLAPPVDFLQEAFLPILAKSGIEIELQLRRYGFYPRGGGEILARFIPAKDVKPIVLTERGKFVGMKIVSVVAGLGGSIAKRETDIVESKFAHLKPKIQWIECDRSEGPGNVMFAIVRSENVTEVFTAFGEKGKRAEQVGKDCARDVQNYLKSAAPVGEYLADQLLLSLAAFSGGIFRATSLSSHTRTNIEVIKMFLDINIETIKNEDDTFTVNVNK
ncbi:MAG: RNA 3'-terminal phosphate cyclase [Planctomycetes bacterium]|nr:RNA 3'-terminal phosphate cyclase [Planctomycetota bacterium]